MIAVGESHPIRFPLSIQFCDQGRIAVARGSRYGPTLAASGVDVIAPECSEHFSEYLTHVAAVKMLREITPVGRP